MMPLILSANPAAGRSRTDQLWAPTLAVGGHLLLVAAVVAMSGSVRPTLPVPARPLAIRFVSAPKPAAVIVPVATPAAAPLPKAEAPPKPARRIPLTASPPPATPTAPIAPATEIVPMLAPAASEEGGAPTPAQAAPPQAQPLVLARFDAAYLNNPKPAYPPAARRRGDTGTVYLRVQVREDGSAAQVILKASSGFSSLDQAALDAVARWKFIPARQGDTPVMSWVVVPVGFSLN